MTFETLRSIIADKLAVKEDTLTLQTNLIDDLKADSLDVVEIIMAVEDEFGVEIDDDSAIAFRTIEDVVKYIDANK